MLSASSSVQTKVTGAALGEFRNEFNGLASGNVTPEELEKSVRTVRFDHETTGDTTNAAADVLAALLRNGRPVDAVRQDLAAIPAADLASVNALAASGLYRWDDLLIVLVGDKETVLPQLAEAGFPAPRLMDVDGKPVN